MEPAGLKTQVAELLQAQEQTLSDLASLLEQETNSLKQRSPELLDNLAGEKLQLAQHLEQSGQQLLKLLEQQGLTANAEHLNRFMEQLGLRDRWQNSVQLLADCQQHNVINGGLIESGRINTDKILGILHGQSGQPRLYGSSGKYDQSAGVSPIGKA